jgi:hypothetical protein
METEDDTTIDEAPTKPESESVKSISKKKADDLEKKETPPMYQGTKSEQKIAKFVSKRAKEMKEYRKSLGIEKRWKEADVEYVPQELPMTVQGKRFETDQQTGIRSRLVPIGDESQNWRSDNSDPMLLNKIQIALSVIIDQNPEAMLVALNKRFEERNALMYALWKRNWEITNAKEILKLFAFNLMKYGWAVGRSYPKVVKYNKKVLVSKDPTDPSKDKYDKKEIEWFNDVAKENMDPWKTWIDENTKPYDYYSMNECYYEVDYTYDQAKIEFEQYANFKTIGKSAKVPAAVDANNPNRTANDSEMRQDIITFGFYENRLKDLYVIYVPQKKIVLHTSPLPNDDGMLSLWQSMWILRDAKLPYGVSLWEIIRQDKQLYDKMVNMTMDQLVLSIMKMFFYTGTTGLAGTDNDGKIKIEPGVGKQILNGDIKWSDIPGPGEESWTGLGFLKQKLDDNSGVSPAIEGKHPTSGKKPTTTERLQATEAAMKRLVVPLANIAEAIEQDAYITLSWMSQVYTTPDIVKFDSPEELKKYEEESGFDHTQMFKTDEEPDKVQATYYPQLSLHMEDRDGNMFESKDSHFFQLGKDIKLGYLKWKGIFKVIPKSILAPSSEIDKQVKLQLFNILVPLLAGDPKIFYKSAKQIIKINEEDEEDWLPDTWIQQAQQEEAPSLFMKDPNHPANQPQVGPDGKPIQGQNVQGGQPQGQSMQSMAGTSKNPTVLPQSQLPVSTQVGNITKQMS